MTDFLRTHAGTLRRQFIVSIHDVTQHNCECVSAILRDLEGVGVGVTSLLVVPDYHRRGVISGDSDAAGWLNSLARGGHEIVLHGYYHLREARPGESLRDRVMTRFYTAGEGEFYDLSQFDAEQRLRDGRRVLREMGLSASGFIAPAWLLGEGGLRACRETGFQYTVLFDRIVDLSQQRVTAARSLVYSTRSAWRRVVSLMFNARLAWRRREDAVLRLSIHPPDREHPAVWSQILRLAREAAAGREVTTYLGHILSRRAEASRRPGSRPAGALAPV